MIENVSALDQVRVEKQRELLPGEMNVLVEVLREGRVITKRARCVGAGHL